MAADIRRAFGIESTLIAKGRGIFDVSVDGTIIFSKYETARYPESSEIVAAIRTMIGAPGEGV